MKLHVNFKAAVLLLTLASASVPQTPSSQLVTPEIRRVGDKLACKCGACNNTVATCQMLGCGYTQPAREKIASLQKAGVSDQQIVDVFVKETGLSALAVPPTEGFHLLGWIMPFIVIALGLGMIAIYWKRFRKPLAASVAPASAVDEQYRRRIERELEEFD